MRIDVLQSVGIDYDASLKRFMGDSELYTEVLNAFVQDDLLERARTAYQSGDRTELLHVAHEVKGAASNVGLMDTYAEASAVVAMLRSGSYAEDELALAFHRFETAYDKVLTGIQAALAD